MSAPCRLSLTAFLFLVTILYSAADSAHAQQKIKLAHASIDTTNAVWYVPTMVELDASAEREIKFRLEILYQTKGTRWRRHLSKV
jgi:hypothetical protein